jgi:hypothetical protein
MKSKQHLQRVQKKTEDFKDEQLGKQTSVGTITTRYKSNMFMRMNFLHLFEINVHIKIQFEKL